MLTRLAITDFAVVRAAELEFGHGMTVVSGETGAGKSLLVDALGFLCGQRADAGVVRHGADRAELAAEFALADAPAARAWLAEQEMDEGEECQLRRVLRADGGSKAWINGRLATASQLTELSGLLVEIHGQHAQQALLSRTAQRSLLDDFGRHGALLGDVAAAARRWQIARDALDELNRRGDVSDRIELLRHQLQELDAETLDADSIASLDADHRRHAHAAELTAAQAEAREWLAESDEGNALTLVQRARESIARVVDHEPRLKDVASMLESAAISLDEAADTLSRLSDDLDIDSDHLQSLEQRLQRLHALARKHRVGVEGLAELQQRVGEELALLENASTRVADLEAEISAANIAWQTAAAKLTKARQKAGKQLADATVALIRELGMGKADFRIALESEPDIAPNPHGAERVEFLIAANPGQPPRPLRKVASGGELSRISLAIEVAALGIDTVPTMVFDEVDTGISGAVADVVGRKLRALGSRCQVMCVTHLPQVAAQGHAHWRVRKASDEGVTMSAVEHLDEDGRIEELARLLGGANIGDAARAAARSLLGDTD